MKICSNAADLDECIVPGSQGPLAHWAWVLGPLAHWAWVPGPVCPIGPGSQRPFGPLGLGPRARLAHWAWVLGPFGPLGLGPRPFGPLGLGPKLLWPIGIGSQGPFGSLRPGPGPIWAHWAWVPAHLGPDYVCQHIFCLIGHIRLSVHIQSVGIYIYIWSS